MDLTGWGRYPRIQARAHSFESPEELLSWLKKDSNYIVHAEGRGYGDCALSPEVIFTRRFNNILDFDPQTGMVSCESGVTLAELIEVFLPRGWFISITPGTKFISVGGAIASDVHGKNHHNAGCFSECLLSFDLMLPDGKIVSCSRQKNKELFRATCGGMGLTGVILTATFRLQKMQSGYIRETILRAGSLPEIFDLFENHSSATYSVAWIDCLAKGQSMGRSLLMLGEFADTGSLEFPKSKVVSLPIDLPAFTLNKYSLSVFNHFYYWRRSLPLMDRLVPLTKFFYPLDAIQHWNRLYGGKGFTQYQLVLPKEASFQGLEIILRRISQGDLPSFLGVLKLFGPENDNYLSFPLEGYSLALDFPIKAELFPFLDELDSMVTDHGGRLYLAKDVRMSKRVFRKGYPGWQKFRELREQRGMKQKFSSLQSNRLEI
jgi:decaprenylphospho-beta-D-ribofuranose 2-oxidase